MSFDNFLAKYGKYLKPYLYRTLRFFSYFDMQLKNKVSVEGLEVLSDLPKKNVMFVSNHETYYMDVILMCQALWNSNGKLAINKDLYFVAAEETAMKSPLLRHIDFTGCVPIKRQWKHDGKKINRGVDVRGLENMVQAIKNGWLINFPTGTVDPKAKIRPGLSKFIKQYQPVVVPVKISGTRKSYGKTGFVTKTYNNEMRLKFSQPLEIDYDTVSSDEITRMIGESIGHPDFNGEDKSE